MSVHPLPSTAHDRATALVHLASRHPAGIDHVWWRALTETASSFSLHDIALLLADQVEAAIRRGEARSDVRDIFDHRVRAICAALNEDDAVALRKLLIAEFEMRTTYAA